MLGMVKKFHLPTFFVKGSFDTVAQFKCRKKYEIPSSFLMVNYRIFFVKYGRFISRRHLQGCVDIVWI